MGDTNNRTDLARPELTSEMQIVNIGLASFAEDMTALGIAVVQVDWRPPAGGDAELAWLLAEMGA